MGNSQAIFSVAVAAVPGNHARVSVTPGRNQVTVGIVFTNDQVIIGTIAAQAGDLNIAGGVDGDGSGLIFIAAIEGDHA